MKVMHHSLRVRLLQWLLVPLALGVGVIGVASYLGAHHEAEEVYDAQLVHFARVLYQLTLHEIREGDTAIKKTGDHEGHSPHAYEKHFAYRVWLKDEVILRSANSQHFGHITQSHGFTERMMDNTHWRVFVLREDEVTIEVAEEREVRTDLIRHVLAGIFLPQLVLLPVLAIIIWVGVRRGIRPLRQLSDLIHSRDPASLSPIEAPAVPSEVAPVIEAINDLMARMEAVLEKEKHFSDYAAHELRTPLAALKTQVQVALRCANPHEQQHLFAETVAGVDRMTHLVDQLLTFVRVQKVDAAPHQHVHFAAMVREVVAQQVPAALACHISLQCELDESAALSGNREMLALLLGNLIDNAIKYSPDGGEVTVMLEQRQGRVCLEVRDEGCGISDQDKPYIFDRFYRSSDVVASGSGLGLAIVKWVADDHRATLKVREGKGGVGTIISVSFAAA